MDFVEKTFIELSKGWYIYGRKLYYPYRCKHHYDIQTSL